MELELRLRTRASSARARRIPGATSETASSRVPGASTVDVGEKLRSPTLEGAAETGCPGVEAKSLHGASEFSAARRVGARAARAGTGSHSQCRRPFDLVKKPTTARTIAGARVAGAAADM